MLDEKADEPFVRAQRRAMDAERRFLRVVAILIDKAKTLGHGEVHLIGRQREFAADDAPDLHVNLRAVKRRFVRDFLVGNLRINQYPPDHVFGLLPEHGFVDVFLAMPCGAEVLKRITYFSMPKILKYFRYISFTALNSAANCSGVQ